MSESNNTLLIDTSPSGDFLTLNGESVWAVRTQVELSGLQQIAKIFGSTIKYVTGRIENTPFSGKEEVVGLGKDVREAGLLYAHLTKRNFRPVESKEELLKTGAPAILITSSHSFDIELLEFLYKPKAGVDTVCGLIFSANPKDLRRQVLVRSAAAHLSGKLEFIRSDVYPLLNFGHKQQLGNEFVGGMASSNDIRAAIGRGAGLLVISTHSDGFDAKLANDLTLCPMKSVQTDPNLFLSPVCQGTQFCHRHKIPMQEFLQSPKLISPEEIAARIFIFNSCYGLRLQSGIVDTGWSLAERFSNSSSLGAIITTWETVITRANQTAFLAQDIVEGMPVGEAVALYNKSSEAKRFGRHRLCLLGDPRVKLPSENPKPRAHKRRKSVRTGTENTDITELINKSSSSRAEFFEVCLSYMASRTSDEHEVSFIENSLAKIREYTEAIRKKSSKADIESRHDEMLEAILNHFINQFAEFYSSWTPLTDKFLTSEAVASCKVCRQPINATNATIRLSKRFRRRLAICPNCGIVEDSPSSLKLELVLDNHTLKIRGDLPRKKYAAKVFFVTSNIETEFKVWDWKTEENGSLKTDFEIPDISSPGFVIISVLIVWSEGYVILRRLTRDFQQSPD